MLQFNNKALTHSFPPSATGTNRHILLGFIATDGGAAPLVPHHVPVSHQAKVILSLCLSHLDRDPGLLDVLAKAFAGTQPTTLPSSSSSSRGVPPHHDQATPASPTGNPESSRQVKPRPTHLPPHTPSIADCLARRHDWSDLGLQADLAINVRDYMAPGQCDLLATALEKIKAPVGSSFSKFWRKAAAWHRYDALASIVACSTYSRSLDFIHCGDGRFSCQDRMLCPRCCYNFMARRVDEELGGSFTADCERYYIVLSLSRDPDETRRMKFKDVGEDEFHALKFRGPEVSESSEPLIERAYGIGFAGYDDLLQCRILWNFFREAIQAFTGNKRGSLFSGATGGPELGIQLNPLRVLPHANYLCWSPSLTVDGVRELRRFVRTKMRDCRHIEAGLYPAIACYRLRTADDLRRVIKYIFKPIDLAAAYTRAAELVDYAPAVLMEINREVNLFLENALHVFWQLRRVSKYGRCHASHGDYIGQVSAYRMAQQESAAERRIGGHVKRPGSDLHPIDRWQLHFEEQFDRPQWPRQSRFERWKAQFDQPQPPMPSARRKV